MPQVRSESEIKPPCRGQQIPREAEGSGPRRKHKTRVACNCSGPPLATLGYPSPSIDGTRTTHNDMLFWVGWFARFHSERPAYVPYEIKTIDCPVVRADGSPLLRDDGAQHFMRCVREVASREVNGTVEWLMIAWNLAVPGMIFRKYATRDNAFAAFNEPPNFVETTA